MSLFLQNAHIESHKKNSVRHKLVSLTLKKKSKITEEVRDKHAQHAVCFSQNRNDLTMHCLPFSLPYIIIIICTINS